MCTTWQVRKSALFLIFSALAIRVISLAPPTANAFGRDDVLALKLDTAAPCLQGSVCLQSISIVHIRATAGNASDTSYPLPCTLPPGPAFLGLPSVGQLSLSGDGRFVSLFCYNHVPGKRLLDVTAGVVAVISADGTVDTSTTFGVPRGAVGFSAVTDDGSGAWVAFNDSLRYVPLGADPSGLPPSISLDAKACSAGIHHVSIVNASELWLSCGRQAIWSISAASPRSGTFGSLPQPGDVLLERLVFEQPGVLGHAVAVIPRGKLVANDRYDQLWTDSPIPVHGNIAVAAVGWEMPGVNAWLWGRLSNGTWAQLHEEPGAGALTLHGALDVAFVSLALARRYDARFTFKNTVKNGVCVGRVRANLYGSSALSAYNFTLTDSVQYGTDTQLSNPMVTVPPWERSRFEFAGVSLAPFVPSLPAPLPLLLPLPTYSSTATPSPFGLPASHTPAVDGPALGDFGVLCGPPLTPRTSIAKGGAEDILLLRIGDSSSTAPLSSFDPLLAQPLFIDIIDRYNGSVVGSLALPRTRNGEHLACTASLAGYRMWPKITMDTTNDFISLVCFDAIAGQDIIPDSYYPPIGEARAWVHPRRVIAHIHVSGFVDTRTFLPPDICGAVHALTAVGHGSPHVEFIVGTTLPDDAPASAYGKCGLRRLPLGARGTNSSSMFEIVEERASWPVVSVNYLYYLLEDAERAELVTVAVKHDPRVLNQGDAIMRLSRMPAMIKTHLRTRGFAPVRFTEDLVSSALVANPAAQAAGRPTVILTERSLTKYRFVVTGLLRPPDRRAVVDMVSTDYDITQVMPDILARNNAVFTVTAETKGGVADDGQPWQPGSVLWQYNVDGNFWTPLANLTGHAAVWVSALSNRNLYSAATTSPTGTPAFTPSTTPTPSHTATMTAAPSTNIRLIAAFQGPMHAALASASISASTASAPAPAPASPVVFRTPPATVVSPALPPSELRIGLARGCIGVAAVNFTCRINRYMAAEQQQQSSSGASSLDPDFASSTGAANAVSDGLVVAPLSSVFARGSSEACIAWPELTLRLSSRRRWAVLGPAAAGAGSGGPTCPLPALLRSHGGYALGYSLPPAEAYSLRCDLLPAASPVSNTGSSTSSIIASVVADVLVQQAAMAIPADILIYRPLTRQLESMRLGRGEPVVLPNYAGVDAEAVGFVPSATAGSPPHEFSEAVAAAAGRLALASTAASSSLSTGSRASFALSGAALLVVVLDHRASPLYPSPTILKQQAARAAASGAAWLRGSAASRYSNCTADDYSAASNALTARVRPPHLRLALYVGGVRANITYVSPDGLQVHAITPSYAAVCAASAAAAAGLSGSTSTGGTSTLPQQQQSCGYRGVRLVYEFELDGSGNVTSTIRNAATSALLAPADAIRAWITAGASQLQLSQFPVLRPAVSCPPFCPSASLSTVETVPIAAALPDAGLARQPSEDFERWMGAIVPGQLVTASTGSSATGVADGTASDPSGSGALTFATDVAALPSAAASSAVPSTGLFFTSVCAGFADPTEGTCANITHPDARSGRCAFGEGDTCKPCPALADGTPIATCPGGSRAHPLPGYWTASESSGFVERCPPPALQRCLGWDASINAVKCGVTFQPQSALCATCATGYYLRADGSCSECPKTTATVAILQAALLFAGILATVLGFVFGSAMVIARLVGGTVSSSSARLTDLLVWSAVTLQVISQVGKTAAVGLPPALSSLLAALAAVQLESVTFPAACWLSTYPFLNEAIQCLGVLLLCSLLAGIVALRRFRQRQGVICCGRRCRALSKAAPLSASAAVIIVADGSMPKQVHGASGASADAEVAHGASFEGSGLRLMATGQSASALSAGPPTGTKPRAPTSSRCSRLCRRVRSGCALLPLIVAALLQHRFALLLAFIALTLMYGLVANTVFGALACTTVQLSPMAYAALNKAPGGDSVATVLERSISGGYTAGELITVSVLARNRSFACYQGDHLPIAVLSWLTLFIYLLGYPLATLLWARGRAAALMRSSFRGLTRTQKAYIPANERTEGDDDPAMPAALAPGVERLETWEAVQAADAGAARAVLARHPIRGRLFWCMYGREGAMMKLAPRPDESTTAARRKTARAGSSSSDFPCFRRKRSRSAVSAPGSSDEAAAQPQLLIPGNLQVAALDGNAVLVLDGPLSHFAGSTYRASVLQARCADMSLLGCLAALQAIWGSPATPGQAAARGVVNVLLLVLAAWWVGTRHPFPRTADGRWKSLLKIGSLLLAALAAVLTHMSLAGVLRFGENGGNGSSSAGSSGSGDGSTFSADGTPAGGAVQDAGEAAAFQSYSMALTAISIAVFIGICALVIALAVGFWASAVTGARVDAGAIVRGMRDAAASGLNLHPSRSKGPLSAAGSHGASGGARASGPLQTESRAAGFAGRLLGGLAGSAGARLSQMVSNPISRIVTSQTGSSERSLHDGESAAERHASTGSDASGEEAAAAAAAAAPRVRIYKARLSASPGAGLASVPLSGLPGGVTGAGAGAGARSSFGGTFAGGGPAGEESFLKSPWLSPASPCGPGSGSTSRTGSSHAAAPSTGSNAHGSDRAAFGPARPASGSGNSGSRS